MSILTKVQWLTTPQNGISKKKKKSVNDIGELVKLLNKITKVSHRRNNSIRIPVIHKLTKRIISLFDAVSHPLNFIIFIITECPGSFCAPRLILEP